MIATLKAALIAGAAGAALGFGGGAWFGWDWRDGRAAKADLDRKTAEDRRRIRNQDRAEWGANNFEDERERIRRDLLATLPPRALATPSPQCPAVAVGDLVLLRGSLDRVRAAAGELGADADPGGPRPAVLPGAIAPGR